MGNEMLTSQLRDLIRENKKINEDLRSVKVWFADGTEMVTSMAAHLTDEEIENYYKPGTKFNMGKGEKDKLTKVKKIKILK